MDCMSCSNCGAQVDESISSEPLCSDCEQTLLQEAYAEMGMDADDIEQAELSTALGIENMEREQEGREGFIEPEYEEMPDSYYISTRW